MAPNKPLGSQCHQMRRRSVQDSNFALDSPRYPKLTCRSKAAELWSQHSTTFYNEQKILEGVGGIGEIMIEKITGTSIYVLFTE